MQSRVMLVVKTRDELDKLVWHFGASACVIRDPRTAQVNLARFIEAEDCVLLCRTQWASQGFRVPADTLILLGPGHTEAETTQIYARAARGL